MCVAVQIMRDMHEHRSHRDVKPANIMLYWQGGQVDVMLIDFAGSRPHGEGEYGLDSNQYRTLITFVSTVTQWHQ